MKKEILDTDQVSASNSTDADTEKNKVLDERRRAVRSILASGGIAVGAATSPAWIKPVVDTVMLPAHAQTSVVTLPVQLAGNAALTVVLNQPELQKQQRSILDLFIEPVHAGSLSAGGDLAGACVEITVTTNTTFNVNVIFGGGGSVNFGGTITGTTMNAESGGLTVSGTVNLAAPVSTASGTVSNMSGTFSFVLDDTVSSCAPLATTTTLAPTTTSGPTTTTLCPPGYYYEAGSCYNNDSTTPPPPTTSTPPPMMTIDPCVVTADISVCDDNI